MALPSDPMEKEMKLIEFGDDINKLANYIMENFPEEVENGGGTSVDMAIRVMNRLKGS